MSGAFLCLVAAPAAALANATVAVAAPVVNTPVPVCAPLPCTSPPAAQLTLTQTVDKTTAAVGDTVSYTITLGNSGVVPAAAVTVDDVMNGTSGFFVDDGTASTTNTFVGQPLTTITRVLAGHYRWSYALVNPGDTDVVRFSAVMTAPQSSLPPSVSVITLASTASTPGVPAATATTTAPFTAAAPPTPTPRGGVHGAKTSLPATGAGLNAAIAGFLMLGGLGFILIGLHAYRRNDAH